MFLTARCLAVEEDGTQCAGVPEDDCTLCPRHTDLFDRGVKFEILPLTAADDDLPE